MNKIYVQYYKSPVGELLIGVYDGHLCLCDWRYRKMRHAIDKRICDKLKAEYFEEDTEVGNHTILQLEEYFHSARRDFDLPVLMVGTEFQKQVWNQLMQVEFGDTSTYMELAKGIGNKDAVRAVANANGANAISIIIPCHRIIGSDGKLDGYAGGLEAKRKLLILEQDMFAPER
ncbi:methylated-DNA--[protein]-cysteine S-methyltransferase [Vibrio hannami]|uniref:methylated-DNA--[protein]-cysteine S-methyltransferase n=1 Tax=Vibrio hannami TaxID=2717094 RepID=UPI00240FFFB6|nr:methylated-DNA--[protein]-cysteine S-methyltransferase [Vibrio hannami]MDG3085576.1 methylated-DNA--[protein]-cysteine S-methyltransferase [Vibrio hannami]